MTSIAEVSTLTSIIEPTEVQKQSNLIRFETELEFVQCLANPFYLQSLAQQDLFSDESFLNYLKYLKYWKQPEFARFIQYPQALHHLDLLQSTHFREALKNQTVASELAGKQLAHWASWRERTALGNASSGTGAVGINGGAGRNGNGNGNANGNMNGMEVDENGAAS